MPFVTPRHTFNCGSVRCNSPIYQSTYTLLSLDFDFPALRAAAPESQHHRKSTLSFAPVLARSRRASYLLTLQPQHAIPLFGPADSSLSQLNVGRLFSGRIGTCNNACAR